LAFNHDFELSSVSQLRAKVVPVLPESVHWTWFKRLHVEESGVIKVAVLGLGPIGQACAKAVCAEPGLQLVGLADYTGEMANQTIKQIGGAAAEGFEFTVHGEDQIVVTSDLAKASQGAELVIMTNTPSIDVAIDRLKQVLPSKCAVISNCDELIHPHYRFKDKARQIDDMAKAAGKPVLGVGVNPGFSLDFLPLVLASMVRRATLIRCIRRIDVGLRRQPLQARVGLTLSPQQFGELREQNKLWRPALEDSVAMIGSGMGLTIQPGSIQLSLDPVLADKSFQTPVGLVSPGFVSGIKTTAKWEDEHSTIELELVMAVGVENPVDRVEIQGPVTMVCKIPGGIPGDSGSVAALINYARLMPAAQAGLRSILDLPIPGSRFSNK
jgi:2,4-diaminopentanoate dehydrogenase